MVWDMMEEGDLLPEKCKPKHLLWTLSFLKCYPKEGPDCIASGGSKGAIDPKTMQKWVWIVLERIYKLADEVVSRFSRRVFSKHDLSIPPVVVALSQNHRSTSRAVSSTTS